MNSIHPRENASKPFRRFIIATSITVVSSVQGPLLLWTEEPTFHHRSLQDSLLNDTGTCYSTLEDDSPNRYCVFDNTPRDQTFLLLSCPDSRGEDLSKCECEIGIGFSEDAPDTPTCRSCSFCSDGTLNYNCENVAGGTCIGRTCDGSCIVSLEYASAAVAHWIPISLWITATLPFMGFL